VGAIVEYAFIRFDHKWDEEKGIIETCQWVGKSRLAEVGLHEAIRETGQFQSEFTVGDFRLRVVDNTTGYRLIVTRDSKWLIPVYRAIHRAGKSLEMIWWCFIHILSIWNLATCDLAEIPTWRNIKALKWVAEKWGLG
jgi:hypothetical protein